MKPTIRICKQCKFYLKKDENPLESYHYCTLHQDGFGENDLLMEVNPLRRPYIKFVDDVPEDCPYILEHTVNRYDNDDEINAAELESV